MIRRTLLEIHWDEEIGVGPLDMLKGVLTLVRNQSQLRSRFDAVLGKNKEKLQE